MCPGSTLSNMRGGSSAFSTSRIGTPSHYTQAPIHAGRDFGARSVNRTISGKMGHDKFVIVEDETGVSIEVSPAEIITVKPDETGGLVIEINPVADTEPANPLLPLI